MKPSEIIKQKALPSTYEDEKYGTLSNNTVVHILSYLDEEKERVNFALKEIIRMFSNQGPDEDNIKYLHAMIDGTVTGSDK